MKEIIIYGASTGGFFLIFIGALLIGILKKRIKLIYAGVVAIILSVGFGVMLGYAIVSRSYKYVEEIAKPRTGEEIYSSLLGNPLTDCVRIIQHQDQVIPKIDYAIFLHFKICPEELSRILSQHEYNYERKGTKDLKSVDSNIWENWFRPELLGDTILEWSYKRDEYRNGQIIYSNLDSTEVYLIDVHD